MSHLADVTHDVVHGIWLIDYCDKDEQDLLERTDMIMLKWMMGL